MEYSGAVRLVNGHMVSIPFDDAVARYACFGLGILA